jgi:hypothetical protein
MKISKEYMMMVIVGMFILAYLLDAVVNPLDANLPSPYHFFNPALLNQFPFTTASVFIKGVAIFLVPLWLASFIKDAFSAKAGTIFVLSALMQLYALQDVVTQAEVIPLEWALSMTLAGVLLLLSSFVYFVKGMLFSLQTSVKNAKMEAAIEQAQQDPDFE